MREYMCAHTVTHDREPAPAALIDVKSVTPTSRETEAFPMCEWIFVLPEWGRDAGEHKRRMVFMGGETEMSKRETENSRGSEIFREEIKISGEKRERESRVP